MDVSKPLRTLARPKASPFAIGFARELAPHFKGFERLEAESTDQGLLIGGVWQPDLDHAFEIVRRAFKGETTWEPSRIHYGEDEYGRPTEPYLLVRVQVPYDHIGNVIGDLSSRRGMITEHRDLGGKGEVLAEAPLFELTGYIAALTAMTQGAAVATAEFHSYQLAPRRSPPDDEPTSAALWA
jgi:hypothetical protein